MATPAVTGLEEDQLTNREQNLLRRMEQLLDHHLINFATKFDEITDRLAKVEVDVGRLPTTRTPRHHPHVPRRRAGYVVHDNNAFSSASSASPRSHNHPRAGQPSSDSDDSGHAPPLLSDRSSFDESASRRRHDHITHLRHAYGRETSLVRGDRGRPPSQQHGNRSPNNGNFHRPVASPVRHRDSHEYRLQIDIPPFNGTLGIEEFLDWLAEVDRFFEHAQIPNHKQASLVACRLKAGASAWWNHILYTRNQSRKAKIHSWRKLRGMLIAEFLPPDYDQTLFQKYQRCQQGGRSVHDYTCEFHRLATRNNLSETTSQQVARFLDGLRPQIRNRIGIQTIHTLQDAKGFALKAETLLQQNSFRGQPTSSDPTRTPPVANTAPINGPSAPSVPSGQRNPEARESARPQSTNRNPIVPNPYGRSFGGKCYRCGQPGHTSNVCPDRRTTNIASKEEGEAETEFCDPVDDGDNEEIDDDDHFALVCRRVMLAPRVDDNVSQRHQLFRTRCTVGDRILNLLIDSGSMENIVDGRTVRQLGLKVEPHPHPYTLGWISSNIGNIRVTEQCPFSFAIHNYTDQVLCDVVEGLDVCHIILGRPWQFDNNAIHTGQQNHYTIEKGGKKFVLLPLPRTIACSPTKPLISLATSWTDVHEDFKREGVAYLLVMKQEAVSPSSGNRSAPPIVQSLLDEFSDLAPIEAINNLPPLRSIQHHIDLIPGASLPNLPHYRMHPRESDTLRQ